MPTPWARSSWLIQMASRKVKIGAVATRIPVSDDEMCCSPKEMSMNGAATCTRASTAIAPQRPLSGSESLAAA